MGSYENESVEGTGALRSPAVDGRPPEAPPHPPEQRKPWPDAILATPAPQGSGREDTDTDTDTDTDADGDADSGAGAGAGGGGGPAGPSGGVLALSPVYRAVAGVSLALVAGVACVHIAMVFLHVAPSNTVTKRHGETIGAWIYPEFEQNWKLFAPNPLQQNIAVQVKAEIRTREGGRETTGWINLTAQDAEAIRGNPLPSHIHQNELRRGWDFFLNAHDDKGRATGPRGRLSESYVRRIAMLRLDRQDLGGSVERIRMRSLTTTVEAPPWSEEKTDTRPVERLMPWWTVTPADRPGGEGEAPARRAEARR
ncbi:DUF5819 family protein [Streptomyces amakusaensis]|uniref:DUF5819 family protein n=1 Tax=Streptomyces amakusaensis TaxID=67271 RepID=A0ABW0AGA4_9ACTN